MIAGDPCKLSPACFELVREICGQQPWHSLKSKGRWHACFRAHPHGAHFCLHTCLSQGAARVPGEGPAAVACFFTIATGGGWGLYF